MKRFKPDGKYSKIAFYVFITIAALMLFAKFLTDSPNLLGTILKGVNYIWQAISTLFVGLVLAYILEPAVTYVQKLYVKIFKKRISYKAKKRINVLALLSVYLICVIMIVASIYFVIPQLSINIIELTDSLPEYVDGILTWYESNVRENTLFSSEYIQTIINNSQDKFITSANEFAMNLVTSIVLSIFSIIVAIFNIFIAFAISYYCLATRKELTTGIYELYTAKFGEHRTIIAKSFIQSVDWVFGKYITAKLIEILLVFLISQLIFILLGVNLSTLMALIVAITNIVPYIGPIIGMIAPVIISLIQEPIKALWVLMAMIGLQALDGYVLQPYIIGDKLGLSPFWVIVVVLVGGKLFGLPGIIFAVPVAAVMRIFILRYIKRRTKDIS